jgi:hypothetical protein
MNDEAKTEAVSVTVMIPTERVGIYRDFFAALDRGERVEIDDETFHYFMEVLTPRHMGRTVTLADGSRQRTDFEFAMSEKEEEVVRGFWAVPEPDGWFRYYAQNTTRCYFEWSK